MAFPAVTGWHQLSLFLDPIGYTLAILLCALVSPALVSQNPASGASAKIEPRVTKGRGYAEAAQAPSTALPLASDVAPARPASIREMREHRLVVYGESCRLSRMEEHRCASISVSMRANSPKALLACRHDKVRGHRVSPGGDVLRRVTAEDSYESSTVHAGDFVSFNGLVRGIASDAENRRRLFHRNGQAACGIVE